MNDHVKRPEECTNMQHIRTEIDRIDRQVIALFGERLDYVHVAAKFKTSEASIRALDRVEAMLENRKLWAVEEWLQPDFVAQLYTDLIGYFTHLEMSTWRPGTSSSDPS